MSELAASASGFPFNISPPLPSEESDGRAMEQSKFDRPSLDRSTFDRLVVEHLDRAQAFAIRLCGNPSDAEDIVQEALLRAHRSCKSFRGESKFRTWFFRIIVNCFRDHLAAGLRPARELRDDVQDTRSLPTDAAQTRELGERVASEVSRLPPRQREVLVMSAYEQMSNSEIAAALGMTDQNIRTTLHLARERLRERLAKYLN
jgi:RNA polymerase sigma-70 factor (ECF subfamily)